MPNACFDLTCTLVTQEAEIHVIYGTTKPKLTLEMCNIHLQIQLSYFEIHFIYLNTSI